MIFYSRFQFGTKVVEPNRLLCRYPRGFHYINHFYYTICGRFHMRTLSFRTSLAWHLTFVLRVKIRCSVDACDRLRNLTRFLWLSCTVPRSRTIHAFPQGKCWLLSDHSSLFILLFISFWFLIGLKFISSAFCDLPLSHCLCCLYIDCHDAALLRQLKSPHNSPPILAIKWCDNRFIGVWLICWIIEK